MKQPTIERVQRSPHRVLEARDERLDVARLPQFGVIVVALGVEVPGQIVCGPARVRWRAADQLAPASRVRVRVWNTQRPSRLTSVSVYSAAAEMGDSAPS